MGERPYTASGAWWEALAEAGVRYVFANLGSDHPGLIEALAAARAEGRGGPPATAAGLPELVVCPHETVALSAAHAYAQVSGQPQVVLVHVDVGTANLGGAVHNAARGRVPVLIFAGASPYTVDEGMPGGRNEFIHWLQDVPDQRGIVRNYTKYDNEVRTGVNLKQVVHRALQIARSEPAGPVYLVAAREVLAQRVEPVPGRPEAYPPVGPAALAPEVAVEIATALAGARNPLVVTGYLGRDPAAVAELVALAELLAVPVLESAPHHVNFPAGHPMHGGYQWTTGGQDPLLAAADVILAVDVDVPWIPATNRPAPDAAIYCVDVDPLKPTMPMWHVPARRFAAANSRLALAQITECLREKVLVDERAVAARRAQVSATHERRRAEWDARERPRGDTITAEYLTAVVREALAGADPLYLSEAVTNFDAVARHLRVDRPGSLIASGGSSLGWAGGGAVGAKLAAPEQTVVALVGDGSYLFGVPAAAQWVARRYAATALTVIYDNRGWNAPKQSVLAVHPRGAAAAGNDFPVGFDPEADLAGIAAAAGGAHAATVTHPDELPGALADAVKAVHGGRSAVVSVRLPAV